MALQLLLQHTQVWGRISKVSSITFFLQNTRMYQNILSVCSPDTKTSILHTNLPEILRQKSNEYSSQEAFL